MPITLYYADRSSAFPALVGLEEAGAAFEAVKLALASGEQNSAEYRAVYPKGRVPALVVDGETIGENTGVLTAIAFRFPKAGLLPLEDAVQLAKAYELIGWFASGAHVAFAQIFRPGRYTEDQTAWPALAEGGLQQVRAAYAEIERRLSDGRDWLLGDRFSLLDPYAAVFWRWAERVGVDTAAYPDYAAHFARLSLRPAVQRALAHETPIPAPQLQLNNTAG